MVKRKKIPEKGETQPATVRQSARLGIRILNGKILGQISEKSKIDFNSGTNYVRKKYFNSGTCGWKRSEESSLWELDKQAKHLAKAGERGAKGEKVNVESEKLKVKNGKWNWKVKVDSERGKWKWTVKVKVESSL